MPFTKGDPNINRSGRPKDSKNKISESIRLKVENFIQSKMDEIDSMWKELDAPQRASLLVKMLDFILPKLRSQDLSISEFETLTDEQLRQLANEIINQSKL
jgi:hypothetical protein